MNYSDLHYLVLAAAYPLANCAVLAVYITGAFHTRWLGFILLSTAIVVLLIPQFTHLFLMIQKYLGIVLISRSAARSLFPVTAIAQYIALGLYILGAIFVVRAAIQKRKSKIDEKSA